MVLPDASRPTVVYIAGLGHSGSTLLDLMLGSHSRLVGLGEVDRTIQALDVSGTQEQRPKICSCGELPALCAVWGGVHARLALNPAANYEQRYFDTIMAMQSVYGRQVLAVDSSKHLHALDSLRQHTGFQLRVIFLVRDVRSFVVSMLDNSIRKRHDHPTYPSPSAYRLAQDWYRLNRAAKAYLEHFRLPFIFMGYEELCMAPEAATRKICAFLGVEWESSMLDLSQTRSHVVQGNRMRRGGAKSTLSYDWRWFSRNEWQFPWWLAPRLRRLNQELVYSHGLTAPWES